MQIPGACFKPRWQALHIDGSSVPPTQASAALMTPWLLASNDCSLQDLLDDEEEMDILVQFLTAQPMQLAAMPQPEAAQVPRRCMQPMLSEPEDDDSAPSQEVEWVLLRHNISFHQLQRAKIAGIAASRLPECAARVRRLLATNWHVQDQRGCTLLKYSAHITIMIMQPCRGHT